jgi:hypothetical protein
LRTIAGCVRRRPRRAARVLVVDDHEDAAELLAESLRLPCARCRAPADVAARQARRLTRSGECTSCTSGKTLAHRATATGDGSICTQLSTGAARLHTSDAAMTGHDVLQNLRFQLVSAMCAAQSLPVPRSPLARMLQNLLHHAFDLLDDDRPVDWQTAQRVAIHALAAWNASKSDGGRLLAAAA